MKPKHRSIMALALFGVVLILEGNVINASANSIAFDSAGNLFLADAKSVSKVAVDGTKSTFSADLKDPLGLTFDGKGNLFVSDIATDSIYKFTPEGKKSTFARGISSFGLACDRAGNLFVSHEHSIFKFTPEGKKSTFVSGLGNALDMAFDEAGNLFVVEQAIVSGSGRSILRFGPDGTKNIFAPGLDDPGEVAVDGAGNVLVTVVTAADASTRAILKFGPDGAKSTFTSAVGATTPSGLAVDRSGNVFVSNEHSILKFDSSGTPSTFASDLVSPNKQWEYRCVDRQWPEIVKAGTTQIVLDLVEDQSVPHAESATVIWAPDSKRFAFNYSPPHRSHSSYETIALYQLRDDKWVALPSPLDETSELAQVAQLAGARFPKSRYPRRAELLRDILKVRSWTDSNTAVLYSHAIWVGSGSRDTKVAFLFTLKFDADGKSKIIKTQELQAKDIED
jgi:sugar lactone lactonase YvrE